MSLLAPSRPALQSVCRSCRRRLLSQPQSISLVLSSSISTGDETPAKLNIGIQPIQSSDPENKDTPRWARTPPAMKAPVRFHPPNKNMHFAVNEDPRKLDEVYVRLLGKGGEQWLPEEVKWLAVTHKSFDYGRRGFNDRLAFLGRRIVELQTSLALLDAPKAADGLTSQPDQYGRKPFQHPSLANIEEISRYKKQELLRKDRVAQLASSYGLDTVARWKPKQVGRLKASGIDVVLNQVLYAIIGGIATQKGGEAAAKVAKERILQPLGLVAA